MISRVLKIVCDAWFEWAFFIIVLDVSDVIKIVTQKSSNFISLCSLEGFIYVESNKDFSVKIQLNNCIVPIII